MGINQSGIRAKTAAEEVNWKFRRKVTPLRSYESDPLFRWKVTP